MKRTIHDVEKKPPRKRASGFGVVIAGTQIKQIGADEERFGRFVWIALLFKKSFFLFFYPLNPCAGTLDYQVTSICLAMKPNCRAR